jgi:hypothetical protein
MMRPSNNKYILLILPVLLLAACDKGYEVRFTNYYTEPIDSLVIGSYQVVFEDIAPETSTGYKPVTRGNHSLKFITRSGRRIYSTMPIPSKGTGKRTVQIDGIEQVHIFEEE